MNCTECTRLRRQVKRLEAQALALRSDPRETTRFYCRARVRIRARVHRCYAAWLVAAQRPVVAAPPHRQSS
jgi:hypothetical protein